MVLVLAWTIGNVMQVLGTDDFIASAVSSSIDKRAISTLVFILGALISLATGEICCAISMCCEMRIAITRALC